MVYLRKCRPSRPDPQSWRISILKNRMRNSLAKLDGNRCTPRQLISNGLVKDVAKHHVVR
jgi:hypothetical protein